jgi:hypothetical protein
MSQQTAEDKAINRRIAKRLGTWEFGDYSQPSRVQSLRELSKTITHARLRGAVSPAITCADWSGK